jgi:ribosomal protein S18 acetylase RimI-like enzyme
LDRHKNVNYKFCEGIEYLAYQDGKIVGRISAVINRRYNEKTNTDYLRFNRFDFVDDEKVSQALFNQILTWGKNRGMKVVNGPIGITDFDKQGLLIEGFQEDAMFVTNYNYAYYVKHFEKLGLTKDVDWLEYRVFPPEALDPRIERLSKAVAEKRQLKLVKFKNKKALMPYVYKAFETYNQAFDVLHGVTVLDKDQIDMYVKQFIGFINYRYLHMVVDIKDDVVGFSVLVPSLSNAARKSKGHLFPFGWYHLLKALKYPRILDMYFIAIKPEYQGLGVNSLIMSDVMRCVKEDRVEFLETGPELEDNHLVQALWKGFNAPVVRRKRLYHRQINEN